MAIKINFPKMLATGALSLFKLEDGNSLLVLAHKKGDTICCETFPIVTKKIFIETDDEEVVDQFEEIINAIINQKIFPELNGNKIRVTKAPAVSKKIVGMSITKGICKFSGINKILEDNGYTFDIATSTCAIIKRDYSELLKMNDFARSVFEENRQELRQVGAKFENLGPEMKMAYRTILTGHSLGIILAGPTGTGKSWAIRIIADELNAPLWTFQIQAGTTPDSLVGSFVPKANEKPSAEVAAKIIDIIRNEKLSVLEAIEQASRLIQVMGEQSKWEFIPGALLRAYTEGWVLGLEEVNFGDPRTLAVLNEFTDGTLRVTVNGIPYKKNPNFIIMLTMNPGYAGTDPLNVALKNRFTVVQVPALTKEQFVERAIAFSKSLGHGLSEGFFNKLFDFANKIEKLAEDAGFHEDVHFSIRNAQRLCEGILTQACNLNEFEGAIATQYLNHLSLDNDNSEKLQKLKEDPSIKNDIAQLYELYDYADVPMVDSLSELSEFTTTTTTSDSEGSILNEDDLDDLLGSVDK